MPSSPTTRAFFTYYYADADHCPHVDDDSNRDTYEDTENDPDYVDLTANTTAQ